MLKHSFLLSFVALGITVPISAQTSSLESALAAEVQAAHSTGAFDGLVLVAVGDRVVLRAAIGLADRAGQRAFSVTDRIPLCSVTKQLTSTLIMQEVGAGRLALDAPVASWLPWFRSDARAAITVRHLLQHTSGLPDPEQIPDFWSIADTTVTATTALFARFADVPLRTEPGRTFAYNNFDFMILGLLLETVTGRTYEQLVAERLAKPAGLVNVALAPATMTPDMLPVGYDTTVVVPNQRLRTYGAAGGLLGTMDDLYRWDRALLDGTVLTPALLTTMFTPDRSLGFVGLGSWVYNLTPVKGGPSVRLVERQGGIGGWLATNIIAPERGWSVIVFTNTTAADIHQTYANRGLVFALVKRLLEAMPE